MVGMKLSTRIRYGFRIIIRIAYHYNAGKPLSLQNIGKQERISEKYISQIIVPLKSAGLIHSFRGVNGGYVLARNPKEINLKEVMLALDEDFNFVHCVSDKDSCEMTAICVMRDVWQDLGKTMAAKLESIRLSDLVKKMKSFENKKNELVYHI